MRNNLIFDVGLHKGEDTDFYLRKGYDVVAFEADPELIFQCEERFRSDIEKGKLIIVEGAIAPPSMGQRVSFYKNIQNSVWGTIMPQWVQRNEKRGASSIHLQVDRVDVADAFKKYGIPFYLKIDIEGADSLVLEALRAFKDRPQYISIESSIESKAIKSELDALSELGYKYFKPIQQAWIARSTIRAKTIEGRTFDYTFGPEASGPFGDELGCRWLTLNECLRAYDRIFAVYRIFGEKSLLNKLPGAMWALAILSRYVVRRPLPGLNRIPGAMPAIAILASYTVRRPLDGWFDTHARLG